MFLDTFMDDASEGIMQNPVPDLADLELECAVSLEAAYSDLMLEGCQVEFQSFCEGSSLEAINEGIFDVIKKFFRTIWNFLKKIFGIKGSGGSSGGGSSSGGSTNTKDQKKEAEDLDKELDKTKDQKKNLDKMKQLQQDSEKLIQQATEELTEKMKEVQAKQLNDISKKMKDNRIKYEYKQKLVELLSKIEDQKKIDEAKQQILDEINAEINKIKRTEIYDPFVDICPISVDFVNDLIDKITEISESKRDKLANNQGKFDKLQKFAEYKFLSVICDVIDKANYEMKDRYGMNGAYLPWQMDVDELSVADVSSRYKKLTAPRKASLQAVISQHKPSYDDYKIIIKQIRDSADDELKVDFQAILNQLYKDTMNDIKKDNSSNQTVNSMIARIKMRLITDLSQIIANMGIANKTARFYQLSGIRTIFHLTRKLDAELAKVNDEKYIESLIQKRIMQG